MNFCISIPIENMVMYLNFHLNFPFSVFRIIIIDECDSFNNNFLAS